MVAFNMNYKARGTLLLHGRLHINEPERYVDVELYVILVQLGNEYVVSKYINGQREWIQGHYTKTLPAAIDYFCAILKDCNSKENVT
jgi:hypothetical protein